MAAENYVKAISRIFGGGASMRPRRMAAENGHDRRRVLRPQFASMRPRRMAAENPGTHPAAASISPRLQ